MKKLYFVSGPSRSTMCEQKYIEVLIRIMCLESGDCESDYTAWEMTEDSIWYELLGKNTE